MKRAVRLAFVAGTLLSTTQASAMNCATRDSIATALSIKYGEQPVSGGLQGDSRLVEVFVSEKDNTWTILVTEANGVSCIVAAGTNWAKEGLLPAGIPG
ncbi:MAG: hypothetical protein AAGH70_03640 [Pseudomonadota bacterium]